MPLELAPPGRRGVEPGEAPLPNREDEPLPLLGLTRSTSGGDVGVRPGMVNTPASSGVTRTMVDVDSIVLPWMIGIWRDWPTIRNSNPETTGSGTDRVPLPEV